MKFVDEVRIQVKAGDGGHGAIAFRREKYVERGGPSGGDGGNGGSVVLVADPQLTTLLDYRYQQHHRAKGGQNGMGSDCNGASAEDLVLKVPAGTLVRDANTGELLADLSTPGERFVAAKGGRGGLGNMNFATSTRQTPRFAQDGTPGEERTLVLELKLLADVGLLGFPNAGKSTLIARVSRAKPKIADYPFTTLVPNLGVVPYKDGKSFVMADIPGLIEGASEGAGLGHQFLRHVERCRVLVHMVDLSAEGGGREPMADWTIINRELLRYSPELAKKPQILVATKMDLPVARERLPEFVAAMKQKGLLVLPISAATGEGVGPLLDAVARVLWGRPQEAWEGELAVARPPPIDEAALGQPPAPEGEAEEAKEVEVVEAGPAEAEESEAEPAAEEGEAVAEAAPVAAEKKSRPTRKAATRPAAKGTKKAVAVAKPGAKATRPAKAATKAARPAKAAARPAAKAGGKSRSVKPAAKSGGKARAAKPAAKPAKATAKPAKKPAAKVPAKKAPAGRRR